jgi:glycosyltransferase involved in cell wall biosynthesis
MILFPYYKKYIEMAQTFGITKNLTKVSIIIPHIKSDKRDTKLERLLKLIKENSGYNNYEVIVENDNFPPNNLGAPKTFNNGYQKATGGIISFLGDDCIPQKNFLKQAVYDLVFNFSDLSGLVSFNDEFWYGEVANHWLAGKSLLPFVGGYFFYPEYKHTGCDSELTQMARKNGKYFFSEGAVVHHEKLHQFFHCCHPS